MILEGEGSKWCDNSGLVNATCLHHNMAKKRKEKQPHLEGAKLMQWPCFVTTHSHKHSLTPRSALTPSKEGAT